MTNDILAVDLKGLAQLIDDEGPNKLIDELIRNSLDEDGVTKINIDLDKVASRPLVQVTISDDAPNGFIDLTHSYTLFANSYKKADTSKAGRFNMGEKLFLAAALLTKEPVTIATTTGTVVFDLNNGRSRKHAKTEKGSIVTGYLKCNAEQYQALLSHMQQILFEPHPKVVINSEEVKYRKPLKQFDAKLPTIKSDDEGVLRTVVETAEVSVYEVLKDEVAMLYELGMPVVATEDKFHVSISKKVPLNMQRDNVKPSYLKTVRTLVFNAMKDHVTREDVNQTWVREATSDSRCEPEAIERAMDLRFGKKRVAYDPSDLEANAEAASKGFTVVTGSMMNGQEWANAKKANVISPAGQVFPTKGMYGDGPDMVEFLSGDKWTPGMKQIAEYAIFLGQLLMDIHVTVQFIDPKCNVNRKAACWSVGNLDFNIKVLGRKWFDNGITEEVDSLLIHEFGHHYCSNHHDDAYFRALTDLGAKLKRFALTEPQLFKKFEGNNG